MLRISRPLPYLQDILIRYWGDNSPDNVHSSELFDSGNNQNSFSPFNPNIRANIGDFFRVQYDPVYPFGKYLWLIVVVS